jgi:hypothetical protein
VEVFTARIRLSRHYFTEVNGKIFMLKKLVKAYSSLDGQGAVDFTQL